MEATDGAPEACRAERIQAEQNNRVLENENTHLLVRNEAMHLEMHQLFTEIATLHAANARLHAEIGMRHDMSPDNGQAGASAPDGISHGTTLRSLVQQLKEQFKELESLILQADEVLSGNGLSGNAKRSFASTHVQDVCRFLKEDLRSALLAYTPYRLAHELAENILFNAELPWYPRLVDLEEVIAKAELLAIALLDDPHSATSVVATSHVMAQ